MKSYKEFINKKRIGSSDYASLILVGCGKDGLKLCELHFGSDGSYQAYMVDGNVEIGEHYREVEEFENWLKIYDDCSLVMQLEANKIIVYRGGEMGCIIQLLNDWKESVI